MTTGTNIFEYIKEINQYLVKVKSHSCNSVCKPIKERDRLRSKHKACSVFWRGYIFGLFWRILKIQQNLN